MLIRFFIAIFIATGIVLFEHIYVFTRVVAPLVNANINTYSHVFLTLFIFALLSIFLIRILPHHLRKLFELIAFTWLGCIFVYFILCVLTIPVQLIFYFFHFPEKYLSLFLFISGIALTFFSLFQALRKPAVIKTFVPVPAHIPSGIENITAIVLSDIHVSGLIGRKKMQKLTQIVNQINPDLIFITGDIVDGPLKQLREEIEPLKNLTAKTKIIYITGNHEYYSGPLDWKDHFKNYFNWQVLSNSSEVVNLHGVTLNILGVEDKHWLSYEKFFKKEDQRLARAVEHLSQNEKSGSIEKSVNILLAHQPKDVRYLKLFPWIHLQISGHTHGGQMWPLKYFVLKDQKYNTGLYKIQNNQHLYVNQGTGFWGPPMRLGTRCEVTLMQFRREK